MIVAAAYSSKPQAPIELPLPEGQSSVWAFLRPAVHRLNGLHQAGVCRRRRVPAAAHADFARRRVGMIQGDKAAELVGVAKQRIDVRHFARADTEVQWLRSAEKVGMTVERRHLSSKN